MSLRWHTCGTALSSMKISFGEDRYETTMNGETRISPTNKVSASISIAYRIRPRVGVHAKGAADLQLLSPPGANGQCGSLCRVVSVDVDVIGCQIAGEQFNRAVSRTHFHPNRILGLLHEFMNGLGVELHCSSVCTYLMLADMH